MLETVNRLVDPLDMAIGGYQLVVGLCCTDWCWNCNIIFLVACVRLDSDGRWRGVGLCVR
jgi:hypothetical protein